MVRLQPLSTAVAMSMERGLRSTQGVPHVCTSVVPDLFVSHDRRL